MRNGIKEEFKNLQALSYSFCLPHKKIRRAKRLAGAEKSCLTSRIKLYIFVYGKLLPKKKPQKSGEFLPLSENQKTKVFMKESEMTPFVFFKKSARSKSSRNLSKIQNVP